MRKSLSIAIALMFAALGAFAQRPAVTTAIFDIGEFNYEKAKEGLDKAVKHEKTATDPKAWYYRGVVYQNLANMKFDWNSYIGTLDAGSYAKALEISKNEDDVKRLQNLSDDPSAVAHESFAKALEYDLKGKYKKKVDIGLMALGFVVFNEAGKLYNDGVKDGETDKDMLITAYERYQRVFDILDIMTVVKQAEFRSELTKDDETMDDDLHFIKFYQARVAYYADANDKAKPLYQELVDAKYESADIYRELANIYAQEKDVESERALWNTARENLPKDNAIAIDEAAFYQRIGEMDKLFGKLEEAIKLNPNEPSLYNVLGGIYASKVVEHNNNVGAEPEDKDESKILSDEDYQKYLARAEELLKKAQEMQPEEVTNYTQLGNMYASQGIVPYNANRNLGFSAADQKKGKVLQAEYKEHFTKAKTEIDKALELDPEHSEAQDLQTKLGLWLGS